MFYVIRRTLLICGLYLYMQWFMRFMRLKTSKGFGGFDSGGKLVDVFNRMKRINHCMY